jgi:hypothetical protein
VSPVEKVLAQLKALGCNPRRSGNCWSARCPAHDDQAPSLSISEGDDSKVLLRCHAGCDFDTIRAALPLDVKDLFPADTSNEKKKLNITTTYDYVDKKGELLYQVCRLHPKSFRQRRPDGHGGWIWNLRDVDRVPYRLPELLAGLDADRHVLIVEGEKDADRLTELGFVATCNAGGAGKWPGRAWGDMYIAATWHQTGSVINGMPSRGGKARPAVKVCILADNDEPGRKHADEVAKSLARLDNVTIKVLELPGLREHGDVSDWLADGGTVEELKQLILDAREWQPGDQFSRRQEVAGDGVYLMRADRITAEHVDYFDEGLIPLRVTTVVTGIDGVGKSTMLYTKAALATRGQLHGAFSGQPVDVVIASSEDHPGSVIKPRLIAAGADLTRVHIVKVRRDDLDGDIALPDDLDQLEAQVRKVNARLLIVDPLVAHLPLSIDSHKAQHVRSVLAPLGHLAEEARLAVAAVVHFNGAPSTDVRSRISGSKALRDASRSVLVCGADPNDGSRYVMVQDKHSFGPRSNVGFAYRIITASVELNGETFTTSKLAWDGEVEIDARGLLAGPGVPEAPKTIAAKAMLEELLADGAVLVETLKFEARKRDLGWRTVEATKADLGVIAEQVPVPGKKGPGPSWWRLPNGPQRPSGANPIADHSEGSEPLQDNASSAAEANGPQASPRLRTIGISLPATDDREDRGAWCNKTDDEAVAALVAEFDATVEEEMICD